MRIIYDSLFIKNHEVLFYVFIVSIILMIVFGIVATYKEINRDNR